MHVITGGSGSGKSAYAEEQIVSFGGGKRIYIATMFPFDDESHKRIARHRRMRKDKGFDTIECYTGLEDVEIPKGACVLLECMSNLVANELYQDTGAKEQTVEAVLRGVEHIERLAAQFVIVTNEIFSHTNYYDIETRNYQKILGQINQRIAARAERVTEVVYGIPVEVRSDNK